MLTVALTVVSLSVNVVPASGYAQQESLTCHIDDLPWEFNDDHVVWGPNKKDLVRAGILKVNDALDYDGTKLVRVPEDTAGVQVQLRDEPMLDYGSAECNLTPSTWVNSNYGTGEFYWHISRHEMLHLAGGLHGGQLDSFDRSPGDNTTKTTMATCRPYTLSADGNVFEQDGHALENWQWSSLDHRQLHANLGFEQGLRFWGRSGSGSLNEFSTGGATGPGYIGWNSSDLSDYVYQTVRIINGDDNLEYRTKVNGESPAATFTTRIRGRLYKRTVNLPNDPGNPNTCEYPDGIVNPNDNTTEGLWTTLSDTGLDVVGTSWTAATSPWQNPAQYEAYDFQVRFYGLATHNSTGGFGQVHIDNVRGEGQ